VCVCSRFVVLSSCIRPYLGWLRCTSDTDNQHEAPLASAARRFAVSRRLRDWSQLVDQLDNSCTPGTTSRHVLLAYLHLTNRTLRATCLAYFARLRSIAIRVSVCVSVCMSLREHMSKAKCPGFTKFSAHVSCGHGLVLIRRRCDVMYFRFCG